MRRLNDKRELYDEYISAKLGNMNYYVRKCTHTSSSLHKAFDSLKNPLMDCKEIIERYDEEISS